MFNGINLSSKIQPLFYRLLSIAWVIPLLALINFVATYGVNVPFWDQWALPDLFQKVSSGAVKFQDLFAQHNEHRILFPRLIFIALAYATRWNIWYEISFSILLSVLSFGLIYKISARQNEKRSISFWLINLSTSAIIFSFVQAENWLWGFQIAWFLINLCLIFCVFCLSSNIQSVWKVGLGAASCFVASFSLAHGLLTWIAVVPLLLVLRCEPAQSRVRSKAILVWTVLFITTCLIYFHGYHKPSTHPDLFFALKNPRTAFVYFFSLLGSPLLRDSKASWILGLIVFISFLLFFTHYLKTLGSDFSCNAAPWISVGLFSVLFTSITMISRVGFGVEQAYSSRYTTVSLLLIIALIQLWQLISFGSIDRSGQGLVAAAALTLLVMIASSDQSSALQTWKTDRQQGKACLEIAVPARLGLNPCLQKIFPDPSYLRMKAKILNRIKFRHDPKRLNFVASPEVYGYLDVPQTTGQQVLIKKSCFNCASTLTLSGWAALTNEGKPASLAVVSFKGSDREIVLGTAPVNLSSPDVAKALNNQQYDQARWSSAVPIKRLPLGEVKLNAWVYDSKGSRMVKLVGDIRAKVEE